MKASSPELLRVGQLLDKLEQRAKTCRGLFPVGSALEFLNLAADHDLQRFLSMDEITSLQEAELHAVSLGLERFWRDPSLCQQFLAQAWLRHRSIPLKTYQPGASQQGSWLQLIQQSLAQRAETACHPKELKSA